MSVCATTYGAMHSNFNDFKNENMKTGREFLNEHIEETNIPAEYWEFEIGEMMDWYADYYHQAKLKLLGIADVSNRRELLIDFLDELKPNDYMKLRFADIVDNYLKRKGN